MPASPAIHKRSSIFEGKASPELKKAKKDAVQESVCVSKTKAGIDAGPTALRWGIVSAGKISHDFTICLRFLSEVLSEESTNAQEIRTKLNLEGFIPRPVLVCVGARDLEDARRFSEMHRIPQAYGNYDDVFQNQEVDVVYIGTIHTNHFPLVSKALECGKHVVCEKPMGMNTEEVEAMVRMAEEKNLFLLEGMWTRFFPLVKTLKKMILEQNVLAKPATNDEDVPDSVDLPFHHISADFCVLKDDGLATNPDQKKKMRHWVKDMGGGALMNIGCYPLHFAYNWLHDPIVKNTSSDGVKPALVVAKLDDDTGVDLSGTVSLELSNGISSIATWSMVSKSPEEVLIHGKHGYAKIHGAAHRPEKFSLFMAKGCGFEETVIKDPYLKFEDYIEGGPFKFFYPGSEGFVHEIMAASKAIAEGKLFCEEFSWQDSVHLAQMMDAIRKEMGLVYKEDRGLHDTPSQ